jgi:predicted dehydrogenase
MIFLMNRRDFLRAGAGAGVSVSLATGVSWAADSPPADRIRIGCVGVGNQGKGNLKAHAKNVTAVCEVDATRLGAAKEMAEAATGKPCLAVSDYRKLLESKEVDAVVVTTPDHWHALVTVDACAAGKDVYCEKPLSLTVAEGQAMVSAARRHKRIVQTGSQQRSDARFRLACELVRNGRIGKVKSVRVGIPGVNFSGPAVADSEPPAELDYDRWLGPAPKRPYNAKHVHYLFRFFWDYSGGQMTNFGAHHLDIAQWGLGMDESGPVSAQAKARFHKDGWYEVPEWCEVVYEYASGVRMICGQSEKQGTTFEGEKGTIYVTRGKLESTPGEIVATPGELAERLYESKDHHRNWLDCIRSRKAPICDVEIGHRSATVCHLGNIAARLGRPLKWDPVSERFVGDAEEDMCLSKEYRKGYSLT